MTLDVEIQHVNEPYEVSPDVDRLVVDREGAFERVSEGAGCGTLITPN